MRPPWRRWLPAALAAGLIAGAAGFGAAPASASAASARLRTRSGTVAPARAGRLSPRLAALAARPSFASPRAAASALSLPVAGPGSLTRESDGRVIVQIRTASTSSAALARLRASGADIMSVSSTYRVVTAAVAPGALDALAHDTDVTYVNEVLRPVTRATSAAALPPATAAAGTCQPTISEGDTLMSVAAARTANQVDGAGQTIGIISDSYDTAPGPSTHAADDVATGDLPGPGNPCGYTTPVTVQSDFTGSGTGDEGRAMAELAHGLAPGARLAFATGAIDQFDFANQITQLRTASHATVIADDLAYFDEPFFQDGPIAQAANASSAAGVPYFSAAGNDNLIVGGHDVSSYEAPAYRPTACPVALLNVHTLVDCHDFDPTPGVDNGADYTLAPGGGFGVDLQWAQPWGITGTDFDAFILDDSGSILADSQFDQSLLHEPFEFLGYTNSTGAPQTVHVVIGRFSGTVNPRVKFIVVGSGGITAVQYAVTSGGDVVGPTIFGHSGAATVGSTAAVPYNDSTASEPYSSHGPVALYYEPTPSTTPLAQAQIIDKPEFAATDNVKNVFFYAPSGGVYRFAGTSAAAPQAAAIGALLKQYDPGLSPAQVIATLRATARPLATNGAPSDVGGGYLDARAALASVAPVPGASRIDMQKNGNAQVTLHWTDAFASPAYPVTSYLLTPLLDGVPQTPRVFKPSTAAHVITGLKNGGTYMFTVTARNVNGAGAAGVGSTPIVIGRPWKPVSVTGVPGNGRVTVSWRPPAITWGLAIRGYAVQTFRNGVLVHHQVFNSPATTTTITGLSTGVTYTFAVKAKNATSASLASVPSPATTVGTPRAPGGVTATAGHKSAKLRWKAAVDNGKPVTRYAVTPYVGGVAQPTRVFNSTSTAQIFNNLVTGRRYAFRVEARNARGFGPKSAPSNVVKAT